MKFSDVFLLVALVFLALIFIIPFYIEEKDAAMLLCCIAFGFFYLFIKAFAAAMEYEFNEWKCSKPEIEVDLYEHLN